MQHPLLENPNLEEINKWAERVNKISVTASLHDVARFSTPDEDSDFPDEVLIESLAARVRPFVLQSESVYYKSALDKMSYSICNSSISKDRKNKLLNEIKFIKCKWEILDPNTSRERRGNLISNNSKLNEKQVGELKSRYGHLTTTTEMLSVESKDLGLKTPVPKEGYLDLMTLAYSWIYSDLVHVDYKDESKIIGYTFQQRFDKGFSVISCLVLVLVETRNFFASNYEHFTELVSHNALVQDVGISNTKYPILPKNVIDANFKKQ